MPAKAWLRWAALLNCWVSWSAALWEALSSRRSRSATEVGRLARTGNCRAGGQVRYVIGRPQQQAMTSSGKRPKPGGRRRRGLGGGSGRRLAGVGGWYGGLGGSGGRWAVGGPGWRRAVFGRRFRK